MQPIDEARLEQDLTYRFGYLAGFLGFVSDAMVDTICGLGLDPSSQTRTLRAFNKLLWLQNDLINRHYVRETAALGIA